MTTPKLRFKDNDGSDFPDWRNVKLNDIGGFKTGQAFSRKYQGHIDKPIDFYKVSDTNLPQNYSEMMTANNTVDEAILKLMKAKPITAPSIIFPKVGMSIYAEKRRKVNKPFCIDNNMMAFIPQEQAANFDFCYWLTQTLSFSQHAQPGTPPSLTVTIIGNLTAYVPASLEEQRKIAELLSAVDEVIAQQQAEVAAWERYKQGVAHRLFAQEVRFKADDGSDFPEWHSAQLGKVGIFYGGLSGKNKADFVNGNSRYVTYKNVYLNTFAMPASASDELVRVQPTEHQNKVKQFDVLFTLSSETFEEVGLSSVYLYDDEPYLNSFCKGFRFTNLEQICPRFIGYQLRCSSKIRHNIIRMGQGISRINLTIKNLEHITIELPCLPEQRKIAECLGAIDEVIALAKAELEKWRELKKGLLQQLFV